MKEVICDLCKEKRGSWVHIRGIDGSFYLCSNCLMWSSTSRACTARDAILGRRKDLEVERSDDAEKRLEMERRRLARR